MTTTDDRPDFEDITQKNPVLDRLRRPGRPATRLTQRSRTPSPRRTRPAWTTKSSTPPSTSAQGGATASATSTPPTAVGHRSDLLRLAGPSMREEGEQSVAWLDAFASHKPGEVLPEPRSSSTREANDYDLDADGVRMSAAVLLSQPERITGSPADAPSPASFAATLRCYRVPVVDARGQEYEPRNRWLPQLEHDSAPPRGFYGQGGALLPARALCWSRDAEDGG